jgi:hypothetical protein
MIIKKRYFTWCVILIIVNASVGTVAQDRPAADPKENDLIALAVRCPHGPQSLYL